MLIAARTGAFGDHPDLIQRHPAVAQPLRAAGKFVDAVRHGDHGFGSAWGDTGLPGDQRLDGTTSRGTPQSVAVDRASAVDLGDDLHQPTVDRIALPGQLPDLLEQHLQPPHRRHVFGERGCRRRHTTILEGGSDKKSAQLVGGS
jgi:hypothetical protein